MTGNGVYAGVTGGVYAGVTGKIIRRSYRQNLNHTPELQAKLYAGVTGKKIVFPYCSH